MTTPNALGKRSADTALMGPPPPKRKCSVVLDEKTYRDGLYEVMGRQFFPKQTEQRAQLDLMEALETKDPGLIKEANKRLDDVEYNNTPAGRRCKIRYSASSATPKGWSGDTPVTSTEAGERGADSTVHVNVNMGLNTFQSMYTTEDNASFAAILDAENQAKAKKNAWALDGTNQIPSGRLIAYREREERQKQKRIAQGDNDGSSAAVVRRIADMDERPAAPDTAREPPLNSLFFNPAALQEELKHHGFDGGVPGINYHNTRLPSPPRDLPRAPSPTFSAIDDAIAGRPRADSIASTVNSTPRPHGHSLLSRAGNKSDSYAAALARLQKANPTDSAYRFKLQDVSDREKLHLGLVDKNNAAKGVSSTPRLNGSNLSTPLERAIAASTPGGSIFRQPGERFDPSSIPADLMSMTPRRLKKEKKQYAWLPKKSVKKEEGGDNEAENNK
ncbi:hypothetical protein K402DRAFT_450996 [Aulographum hederae CBS 113979]|uniref:Nuclear protein DGCR14 n=1 Tax=Aulographum hederae CBS 113979 TaxID=1176131 RepID=A0A6G1HCC6_9PEZI|nr:hypothetical protein K402DRAFT_450996 [Aulographum hederae CBS 113979]